MKLCVQVKLMSECSGSVNRVKLMLNDHEEPEEPGLSCGAEAQTSTGATGGLTLSRFPQPKKRRPSCQHPQRSKYSSQVDFAAFSPTCCSGVIERWELLQAQRLERPADLQQDLQQRQKLNSDLCDVTSWLGRVLPELERLQSFTPATSIRDFKVNIQRLKVRKQESDEEAQFLQRLMFLSLCRRCRKPSPATNV